MLSIYHFHQAVTLQKPLSKSNPNTVIFNYDIDIKAADSGSDLDIGKSKFSCCLVVEPLMERNSGIMLAFSMEAARAPVAPAISGSYRQHF